MRFENLIPVLDVRDVDVSIDFYRDTLGFSLADKVEWSGRTEWALLRTGKINLMLCRVMKHLKMSCRAAMRVYFSSTWTAPRPCMFILARSITPRLQA